jgi:hypothetical protein
MGTLGSAYSGIQLLTPQVDVLGDDALDELLYLGVIADEATLWHTKPSLEGAYLVTAHLDTLALRTSLALDQTDSRRLLASMLRDCDLTIEALVVE